MHFPHAPHRSNYFTVFRKGDWKLIYHYLPEPSSPRMQLFDLSKDPYEQTDLAETRPGVRDKLLIQLHKKLIEQQALYPVNQDGQAIEPTRGIDFQSVLPFESTP
jgi:arylsulfatase A-like enzyme